jgi:hypothetical protein
MFVSVAKTHSNPVTVANMIRVNGLDAVRRSRMVRPDILLQVRRSAMKGELCEYRKMVCERRISRRFMAAMKFARMHGPECLSAAEVRPYAARVVSAYSDAWNERIDHGEIGRRHGWDVGLKLNQMSRPEIYARAMEMGLDLEAMQHPEEAGFLAAQRAPSAVKYRAKKRVMRRTCRLFGVTPDDLRGFSRNRQVAVPRHFYAFWMMKLVKASYPEIGRSLGGRDHTTALSSVRKWPGCRDEARAIIQARRLTGRSAKGRA